MIVTLRVNLLKVSDCLNSIWIITECASLSSLHNTSYWRLVWNVRFHVRSEERFLSILTGCSESQSFTDYSFSDPFSHFAAEGDKARIKSSKLRQSLTSSSLEARRLINASFGIIILFVTILVKQGRPMSNNACLLCFYEIITEIFHERLEFLNKTNFTNVSLPSPPHNAHCWFALLFHVCQS